MKSKNMRWLSRLSWGIAMIMGLFAWPALAAEPVGSAQTRAQPAKSDAQTSLTHAVKKTEAYPYPLDTCVVSGEKLGGEMGPPAIYHYKGREVRFCCGMCIKDFKADPAKYLKKIDDAVIKQQLPTYPLDTCVVSGHKLSASKTGPVNYVYKGRLVRFGSPKNIAEFNKNPEKYLAIIDKACKKCSATKKEAAAKSEPATKDKPAAGQE
jgi:YHS domain-containing protein